MSRTNLSVVVFLTGKTDFGQREMITAKNGYLWLFHFVFGMHLLK